MKTYIIISYVILATFLEGCGNSTPSFSVANGQSCKVETVEQGALITCPDGSQSLVSNGTNGIDGTTIVAKPFCPTKFSSSGFQESYFLFPDGIYAIYYGPPYSFLLKLPPRSYVTTDNSGCSFTVNANNTITEN